MNVLRWAIGFVIACQGFSVVAQETAAPGTAAVDDSPSAGPTWRLLGSPYTYHYSRDPEHKYVWAVGVERESATHGILGASYFSNSFGQPSGYIYGGERLYGGFTDSRFYAQWTAGLIYGYRGQFAHKVPLNYKGFSPGAVLSVGYQFAPRVEVQLNVLGTSALMLQFNVNLN
jgi:hypothetical protein